MSVNDYRKCSKCRRTRAEDRTISYHRFPNPGKNNVRRANAWAKYCWPSEDWSSVDILLSLHKSNKVLCGRHFSSSQFYDNLRKKLSKFAIPDLIEVEEESVGLPESSTREKEILRRPLSQIEHIMVEPSTSGLQLQLMGNINTETAKKSHLPENDQQLSTYQTHQSTTATTICEQKIRSPTKLKSTKSFQILKAIKVSKLKEMTEREIKLYNICRQKIKEIFRLRKKIKDKKKANILKMIAEDDNVQKLCNLNLSNSFVVLLQSQLKNCPRKPKGRRYTLHQKIMALIMYKKSPACYRLLKRMFALPCQSSLNKLLNRVPLKVGINQHIFASLKEMAEKHTDEENLCILSFDEMSIRKHLHYDLKEDEIMGFQDHAIHGKCNQIATKVMVFMLAGLRKKWKQPIAFYFSHSLTADRMTVILKELLTECFKAKLNIVSTVCDLSTVNLKVLRTLGATTRDPYFRHDGNEITCILDPPHLLKCTRNLLMKHNIECTADIQCENTAAKGIVKWSHIVAFYNMDKSNMNFVYAPALTEHHIHPNVQQQMRVKYAAQVLSHSVAAGILAKIASNELPSEAHATAMFAEKFDQLFDAVNADSPDLRRGKKYSTNLTRKTSHLELFNKMRRFISSMKYLGSKSNPPSQDGWIHTLNAIERLWKKLQSINYKSLSTRRLNQDPLENFFGCIRYSCGSNNNPTMQQFVGGVKTAIISNLKHAGQKKNCEDDTAILSNNLASFLTADIPVQSPMQENVAIFDTDMSAAAISLADAVEEIDNFSSERQACGYVSGFIFKKLKHKSCEDCQKAFLSKDNETIHIFTSFKEYSDDKSSLYYVNRNVIECVEVIATTINNFLKLNAHIRHLKYNIMAALDNIDFSFLDKCVAHKMINIEHLKYSTFFICIKRYTTVKNREMDEEDKAKSMQRKMNILKNK